MGGSESESREQFLRKRQQGTDCGQLYEILLLMLFFKRGHFEKLSFKLGTQVAKGEKFDDLVFRYSDPENQGKHYYRFLQSKHIQDESKRITSNILLSEKYGGARHGSLSEYFNLQKYFNSYLKIRKEYGASSVKDVVLFTNINFDISELERAGIETKELESPDAILHLSTAEKHSACYQLKVDPTHKLYQVLKETSDLKTLAKELVMHAIVSDANKKSIRVEANPIFKMYHIALTAEVIDEKAGKFKDHFIAGRGISQRAMEFRQACLAAGAGQGDSEDNFWRDMERATLKLSRNFGNMSKAGEDTKMELPNDVIHDEDIDDFLDHLIFAVNQPNTKQLAELIENTELKQAFNLINTAFLMSSLENTIHNFVSRNKNRESWITNEESKEFFEQAMQLVIASQVVGLTLEHKGRILKSGVEFEAPLNGLSHFLQTESTARILHVISTSENDLLNSIKVCQYLGNSKEYQAYDSHIFVELQSLLDMQMQNNVAEDFGSTKNKLLILRCNGVSMEQDVLRLYSKLSEIMKDNANKKVIFIGGKKNAFISLFKQTGFQCDEREDKANSFSDLTPESQEKVLKRETLFQGQKIRFSELIEETPKDVIDTSTLVKLVQNEEVTVGNKPLGLGDLEAAFARLYEDIPASYLVEALLNCSNSSSVFMISGVHEADVEAIAKELTERLNITEEKTEKFSAIMKQICLFENYAGKENIVISSDRDRDDNAIRFKELCRSIPDKTIHSVKVTQNSIHLQQVYDPDFYLKRQFKYQKKIVIKLDIKKQLSQPNASDVFIFSNIGGKDEFVGLFPFSEEEKNEMKQLITNDSSIIIRFSDRDANRDLRLLSDCGKPVHWLRVEEGQLVWQRSRGSLNGLRKYVDQEKSETLLLDEVEFFTETLDKVVIVADHPGMGKSTTLVSLAEQVKKLGKTDWVLPLTLKDNQNAISNLSPKRISMNDVVRFLSKIESLGFGDPLSTALLEQKLKGVTRRPVLLLFDGFDEISDVHQVKVIKLLQFLKDYTSAKVWVTTRPYETERLENSLSVFSTRFKKLSLQKKKEFLRNLWKVRLTLSLAQSKLQTVFSPEKAECHRFDAYAEMLFDRTEKSLGKKITRFMGIPLQLRLFAEAFEDEFREYASADDDRLPSRKKFDLVEIYQSFIRKKYDIYFKEKKGLDESHEYISLTAEEAFDKRHQLLAFNRLFSNVTQTEVLAECDKLLSAKEKSNLQSIGIVLSIGSDGECNFIHKTFAEYFSASLLADVLLRGPDTTKCTAAKQFLLEQGFKGENEVMCNFLDLFLTRRLPLHSAILNDEECVDLSLHAATVDCLGRTALHLAGQAGDTSRVRTLLIAGFDNRALDCFGRTVLHYAARYGHTQVMDCLQIRYDDAEPRMFGIKFLNHFDEIQQSPLHYAVLNKHWPAAIYLLYYGADSSWMTDEEKNQILSHSPSDIYYTLRHRVGMSIAVPVAVSSYDYRYDNPRSLSGVILHRGTEVIRTLMMDISDEKKSEWIARNRDLCGSSPIHRVNESDSFSDDDHLKVLRFLVQHAVINEYGVAGRIAFRSSDVTNILESAAMKGHAKTFKFLLGMFAKDFCDLYIYAAAKNNQMKIVDYLWRKCRNDTSDAFQNTALHTAAHGGITGVSLNVIKYFIQNGADVNSGNVNGETPLHMAICSGCRLDVVKYLVDNGADINVVAREGKTLLYHAICDPPNYATGYPEYYAINRSQHNIIKYLVLNCQAEVKSSSKLIQNVIECVTSPHTFNADFVEEDGLPRLHQAICAKEEKLVRFLLRHGASVNKLDGGGKAPLHWGACSDDTKMLELLLQYGAVYDAADHESRTPFDWSQSDERYSECAAFLKLVDRCFNNTGMAMEELSEKSIFDRVKFMPVIHARNSNGDTLLHITAGTNNLKAIQYLLQFNRQCSAFKTKGQFLEDLDCQPIRIDAENSQGNTPLHLAARNGCIETTRFLLECGAPFDSRNGEGRTPLDLAESKCHENVVDLLRSLDHLFSAVKGNVEPVLPNCVSESMYLNAKDSSGKTVLHWAARNGYVEIVNSLLQRGSDLEATDINHWTPLHHAADRGLLEVARLLLRNGAIYNTESKQQKTPLDLAVQNNPHLLSAIEKAFKTIQSDCPESVIRDLAYLNGNSEDLQAAVCTRDAQGNTLLHYAAKEDSFHVVEFLLRNGARSWVRNKRLQTPSFLAHHQYVIELLQSVY